ncbi:MAG: YjjG family noncanonical pyrimidine nucleotidase [Synergistaceae bacterium]|jgi:2-haloacid dehalogenase|nr:YjjG family noncanonical pyrimidine nucleotidase [Synergistaceae bacterium]
MAYSTILFDADGTLFDYDRAEEFALASSFRKYGIQFSQERNSLYREINDGKWKQFEAGVISKDELQTSRFAGLFAALGIANIDAARFNKDYLGYLACGSELIDGAVEVCRSLSATMRLAIITNGIATVQLSRFSKSEIKDYISYMFVSEEIGYAKPDARYFDFVFDRMGPLGKPGVLVVGDSLTSDIQGGVNYGLDTCYYNPRKLENLSGIKPTFEIGSLAEIFDWI